MAADETLIKRGSVLRAAPGVVLQLVGDDIEAHAPLLRELYEGSFECEDAGDFILWLREQCEAIPGWAKR